MNYRDEVMRVTPVLSNDGLLTLAAIGLAGESGETIEHIKKYLFNGKTLNRTEILKELGDVRAYMEILLHAVGSSIEEIERINVEKLRLRYPDGYSNAAAQARKDEA